MRKEIVITVAGTSSRFSESIGRQQVKCIYNEGDYKKSLLYRLVTTYDNFDDITIVGGYRIDELKGYIDTYLSSYSNQIHIVYNPHFEDYGSGYSLYLGLKESFAHDPDEIVFAEGDLWLDRDSFLEVCNVDTNVITTNSETITAKKSVALYTDLEDRLHYIYDVKHGALQIDEPFNAIYNSGQVWKFTDIKRLREVIEGLSKKSLQGTNLEVINGYFSSLKAKDYSIIRFNRWINANTVSDYRKAWELDE